MGLIVRTDEDNTEFQKLRMWYVAQWNIIAPIVSQIRDL